MKINLDICMCKAFVFTIMTILNFFVRGNTFSFTEFYPSVIIFDICGDQRTLFCSERSFMRSVTVINAQFLNVKEEIKKVRICVKAS